MNEREMLIKALAAYVTTNISRKTHEMLGGQTDAINWAIVFRMLKLPMNATKEQAEAALRSVLDAEAAYPPMVEVIG